MLDAPNGAVFVWCNSRVFYAKQLAQHLERGDLAIRPFSWLREDNVKRRRFTGVILDHAANPSLDALEALDYINSFQGGPHD